MITSSQGVVLTKIKYSETSIICKIFTKNHGLKTYLVRGARKKKATLKSSLFHPLYRVDISGYNKEGKDINILREINLQSFNQPINYQDPRKSAISVFFAEIIASTLPPDEPDNDIYSFVSSLSEDLEELNSNFAGFVVFKIWRLTRFLGIIPSLPLLGSNIYFDLKKGEFVGALSNEYPIELLQSNEIKFCLTSLDFSNFKPSARALQIVLDYLKYHTNFFKTPKSLEVLKAVFN